MKDLEANQTGRLFWLSLAVLFTLAAGLRLYRLGVYSLWLDESHTWFFTQLSWGQLLPALRTVGVHPPFYFALEKLVTGWLGDSETGLRLLSVICDLLSITLATYLGWISAKEPGALAAAWFWAFNPFTLWFAQEARPYALAALLSLGVLIVFMQARSRPSARLYLAGGILLALGLMTHFFFILALGATCILALFELRQNPRFFRSWTLTCLAALLPFALWLTWFFLLPQPSFGIGWIAAPNLADLPLTLWNFLSGYAGSFNPESTLFGLVAGFLIVVGLSFGAQAPWNRRLFLAGVLLPLLATWLVSFRRPIYIDRYYLVLLPFLLPILACGGDQALRWAEKYLPKSVARTALGLFLLGIGCFNARQVHSDVAYLREDWRGLAETLRTQTSGDFSVWFQKPETAVPFEYSYRFSYPSLPGEEIPACVEPCWWVLRQPYTATHAFTQAVSDPERPWLPELPIGCQVLERWDSPTGIALWKVDCQ